MKTFVLVLARDGQHVAEKVEELERLGVHHLIVCGQKLNGPNIVYKEPRGKYDAINFGFRLIPSDTDVVVLNDVDTRIRNFEAAVRYMDSKDVSLVFVKVCVREGPQILFYRFLDNIRRRLPIAASGELMLIRYKVLKEIIPIKPCKAEDSYILFKILESKYSVVFCEECSVETVRTNTPKKEENYKRRTAAGIYQALAYTNPPYRIKLFYIFLPAVSALLMISGESGYYWAKGILLGFVDYLRGDRTGVWQSTDME